MTTITTSYLALTASTAVTPASLERMHPPGRHLVGLALVLATCDAGRWRMARRVHAIQAGEPETDLLEWASTRLPAEATLIGWDVDHGLMPVLLDAASTAAPDCAQRFLSQLHPILRRGVVDLSLEHGGAGAPPFASVATEMAIYAPSRNADGITSAWATGRLEEVRRDLADEAVALWRLFLRTAGVAGVSAEAATDAWIARRRALSVVGRPKGTS